MVETYVGGVRVCPLPRNAYWTVFSVSTVGSASLNAPSQSTVNPGARGLRIT